jgi:hypothetical protein
MIGILRKQSRAVFVACHAILRRKIKSKKVKNHWKKVLKTVGGSLFEAYCIPKSLDHGSREGNIW